MNADILFIPLIQAIADREYLALKERLEWANIYLQKNHLSTKQRKSKYNNSLIDIYAHFDA